MYTIATCLSCSKLAMYEATSCYVSYAAVNIIMHAAMYVPGLHNKLAALLEYINLFSMDSYKYKYSLHGFA